MEARQLRLQKVCDESKQSYVCMHCCWGNMCNSNDTWEDPAWHKMGWDKWMKRLTEMVDNIKILRKIQLGKNTMSSGAKKSRKFIQILSKIKDAMGEDRGLLMLPEVYFKEEDEEHSNPEDNNLQESTEVNEIFIHSILSSSNQELGFQGTIRHFTKVIKEKLGELNMDLPQNILPIF